MNKEKYDCVNVFDVLKHVMDEASKNLNVFQN